MLGVNTMTTKFALSAVLASALLAPVSAMGATLLPDEVIFPTGVTFTPENSGLVINDNMIQYRMDPTPITPFTDVGGNVQNRVMRNDFGNLVFAPRIRDTFNIDGGTFGVIAFRLEGYGDFATDIDFRTDGLGEKPPTSVTRSMDGDSMIFRYDDPIFTDAIAPGVQETSFFPSIITDATAFDTTGSMTIFGQLFDTSRPNLPIVAGDLVSVTVDGLAVPTAAIPLPAPVLMMGAALAGLIGLRRKA